MPFPTHAFQTAYDRLPEADRVSVTTAFARYLRRRALDPGLTVKAFLAEPEALARGRAEKVHLTIRYDGQTYDFPTFFRRFAYRLRGGGLSGHEIGETTLRNKLAALAKNDRVVLTAADYAQLAVAGVGGNTAVTTVTPIRLRRANGTVTHYPNAKRLWDDHPCGLQYRRFVDKLMAYRTPLNLAPEQELEISLTALTDLMAAHGPRLSRERFERTVTAFLLHWPGRLVSIAGHAVATLEEAHACYQPHDLLGFVCHRAHAYTLPYAALGRGACAQCKRIDRESRRAARGASTALPPARPAMTPRATPDPMTQDANPKKLSREGFLQNVARHLQAYPGHLVAVAGHPAATIEAGYAHYSNQQTVVEFACARGHHYTKPFNKLSLQGCPTCWEATRGQSQRLDTASIADKLTAHLAQFPGRVVAVAGHPVDAVDAAPRYYQNQKTEVEFECERQHRYTKNFTKIGRQGCPTCARSSGATKRVDVIAQSLADRFVQTLQQHLAAHPGDRLVSVEDAEAMDVAAGLAHYRNLRSWIGFTCGNGHAYRYRFDDLVEHGCPACAATKKSS